MTLPLHFWSSPERPTDQWPAGRRRVGQEADLRRSGSRFSSFSSWVCRAAVCFPSSLAGWAAHSDDGELQMDLNMVFNIVLVAFSRRWKCADIIPILGHYQEQGTQTNFIRSIQPRKRSLTYRWALERLEHLYDMTYCWTFPISSSDNKRDAKWI